MKEKRLTGLHICLALGVCLGLLSVSVAIAAVGDIERITDLTFEPQKYIGPSISGEGRFVAYHLWEGPSFNHQVFVHDRDMGTVVEIDLYPSQDHDYEHPALSADGEWLAYVYDHDVIHLLEWQVTPWNPIVIPAPVQGLTDFEFSELCVSADGCRVGYEFHNQDADERDVYYADCNVTNSILVSKAFGSPNRGNGNSGYASISDDGQFMAFSSDADDLVATNPPTDGMRHVYVRDLDAEETKRILLPTAWATKFKTKTHGTSLSADGCYVAFEFNYWDSDMSPEHYDIFLYDCNTDKTKLISVFNGQPSTNSDRPTISGDGRFVVFQKEIGNFTQLHVFDAKTGAIKLISTGLTGGLGNGDSGPADISADGRIIAFESCAPNLVAGDTNNFKDAFVYENDLSIVFRGFLPLITR